MDTEQGTPNYEGLLKYIQNLVEAARRLGSEKLAIYRSRLAETVLLYQWALTAPRDDQGMLPDEVFRAFDLKFPGFIDEFYKTSKQQGSPNLAFFFSVVLGISENEGREIAADPYLVQLLFLAAYDFSDVKHAQDFVKYREGAQRWKKFIPFDEWRSKAVTFLPQEDDNATSDEEFPKADQDTFREGQMKLNAIAEAAIEADRFFGEQGFTSILQRRRVEKKKTFGTPIGASWRDISIVFTSETQVAITCKDKMIRASHADLGFDDKRSKNQPNILWKLLAVFAINAGTIGWDKSERWRPTISQIHSINKKLKEYFELKDNPINYERRAQQYRVLFSISHDWGGEKGASISSY